MALTIAQIRQALPHLNSYTDDQIADVMAKVDGVDPKSSGYGKYRDDLLGYNRSVVDAVKDTGVGLGQSILGAVKGLATLGAAAIPGVRAYDNATVNYLDELSNRAGADKSQGFKNREASAARNVDIAAQKATDAGAGFWGRIGAEVKAQGGNYLSNPQLAVQDAIANLPQMVGPAVAGRVGQIAGAAAGLGAKGALALGTAAGVGTAAELQGTDVGSDTYQRMRAAGATQDQATQAATTAGLKGGAATVGLAMLPFGSTIERSLLRGATTGSAGMGALARRAASGGVEAATEATEEGYGRYANNQEMRAYDGKTDLAGGVGQAAVQGAVVAGPMGAASAHAAPHARAADGTIDLTQRAPSQVDPLDVPTYARRGLDPLNERSSPYPGPATLNDVLAPADGIPVLNDVDVRRTRAAQNAAGATGPGTMVVTNDGTVLPAQNADQMARTEQRRQFDEGVPTLTNTLAPADGIPVLNDVVSRPTEAAPAAEQSAAPAADPAAQARPSRGDLLSSLNAATTEVASKVLNKDGTVSKRADAAPVRQILESADPLAAIREAHQDGRAATDELLDAWHKKLTGSTVFEHAAEERAWQNEQAQRESPVTALDTNSAGFVAEPAAQVAAQLDAVREGRKPAVVMGEQEAAQAKTDGLVTDTVRGNDGSTAVVAARDQATLDMASARAKEVGLKQAMGETLGVVDPTLTTQTAPDAVTVQQVDNKNGQVVAEELARPGDVPNVTPVDGTTPRVVSPEQAIADRQFVPPGERAPFTNYEGKKVPFNHMLSQTIVEDLDRVKDEAQYNAGRYEMYKRWERGDEVADDYFKDTVNKNQLTKAEAKEFAERFASERQAKQDSAAKALAKKFGASYRLNPTPTNNYIAPESTRAVVEAMTRNWGNLPEIEVVDNTGGLPARLRTQMEEDGVSDPKGAFFGGKVYVISDSHTSSSDVVATVLHEVAGHFGLRGVLGSTYPATMASIYNGNADVRAAADRMISRDGLTKELATEEVLAGMAEQGSVAPTIAERILNSIRQLMRRVGLSALARGVTNGEVNEIVANARAFVESGNAGPVVSDDAAYRRTVRESVVEPLSDAARTVAAEVRATVSGAEISPKLLSLMTMRQIEEQFSNRLPALKDWIGALMERGATASKIAAEADRVALTWEQSVQDPAQRKALADVLLGASVNGLELDNHTPKYMNSLDAAQKKTLAQLRAKLDALSPEAKATRRAALDVLSRQWDYTRKSLESFIDQTVPDPELRNAQIEKLKELMGRQRGDYFPLSRFGDRIVVARDAASDGRDVVTFHETAASAEAELKRWKDQGVRASITLNTKGEIGPRQNSGLMGDLHRAIDESGADPAAKNELHDSLQQLFLKSLPEISGAKFMIRRENVEGYSRDALRVFADAVTRGSRYAAHLEFAPRIQAAQESARTQSRSEDSRTASVVIGRKDGLAPHVEVVPTGTQRLETVQRMMDQGYATEFFNTDRDSVASTLKAKLPDLAQPVIDAHAKAVADITGDRSSLVDDTRGAKALYNHMLKMQAPSDPSGAVVDALGKVGYVWFLGLSPAFWAMNTLQNPMIGLPQLGSKFGINNSSKEWLSAVKWFSSIRMGKLIAHDKTPFSIDWLRKEVADGRVSGINKEELDMLQTLEDRQVLDFTQAMDLSRIGEASSSPAYKAMRFAAAGAHHTEVFNRVTFALAAYRLAMKSGSGITHDTAVKSAENDVAASHFDYSPANKPTLMRGSTSRLMFMFQQYRQHMLYWWAKNVKDMVKNENPGDRAQATKAALLMGATHLTMAGAMGLPFAGSIALLANLLGGSDDDGVPFDFNTWIRDAAANATGSKKAGEVMANGVFSAMNLSIGKRIGQGDILPFLNENGSAKFERNTDDKARAYLFDLLGPLGSIALGGARALDSFSQGDTVGGLANVTPKAISDVLKAYKLHTDGLKDKKGNAIATAESFDGWDVATQAAGVQPTSVANIKADGARVREIDRAIQDNSRRITTEFVEAWMRQDKGGMEDALKDVQKFNAGVAKYKDKGLLLNSAKLENAIKERKTAALLLALTGGTADNRRQMMIATQASGLFNDVNPGTIQQNRGGLPGLPGLPGLGQ